MRIVVKVGTSTLAHSTGRLNIRHTEELVKVLSDLKNAGHEVILVSSGAIGMGVGKLSLSARPTDMSSKQACAAVGQCELMYTYDRLFSAYDHTVAQILLTGVDIEHASRRENIQNTLTRLLELGALPIINENDTVATDEITSIGDNDTRRPLHCQPPHPPGRKAHPAGGGHHARSDGAGRRSRLGAGYRRNVHQTPGRPDGDLQRS